MRPGVRILACAVASSAAIGASQTALAQQPAPGAAPLSPVAMQQRWAEHRQEREQARAAALHAVLNLRPDQEPAFQAFVAATRPPEGRGKGMDHGDQAVAPMTTPQRLDRMAARMAERQAAFQRRADAVRRFYGALSPAQQRAFDALHALRGGGREGREAGHRGFGHHGMG